MSAENHTSSQQASGVEASAGGRLYQYRRRVNLISWVAAGLLAEITVYASIRFGNVPDESDSAVTKVLLALVPSCVLIAGAAAAWARAQFEWLANVLERGLDGKTIRPDEKMVDVAKRLRIEVGWPKWPERLYITQLVLSFLGGIFLLGLIWWIVVESILSRTPEHT